MWNTIFFFILRLEKFKSEIISSHFSFCAFRGWIVLTRGLLQLCSSQNVSTVELTYKSTSVCFACDLLTIHLLLWFMNIYFSLRALDFLFCQI